MQNQLASSGPAQNLASAKDTLQLDMSYNTPAPTDATKLASVGLVTFNSTPDSLNFKRKIVRKYHCLYCDQSFTRSEHKTRHERSHTKEKPFRCPKCSAKFVRKDLLLRHDRTVHGNHPKKKRIMNPMGRRADRDISPDERTDCSSMSNINLGNHSTLVGFPPSKSTLDNGPLFNSSHIDTFFGRASAQNISKQHGEDSGLIPKSSSTKGATSPSSLTALLNVATTLGEKRTSLPPSPVSMPSSIQMVNSIPQLPTDQSYILQGAISSSPRAFQLHPINPNQKQSPYLGQSLDRNHEQNRSPVQSHIFNQCISQPQSQPQNLHFENKAPQIGHSFDSQPRQSIQSPIQFQHITQRPRLSDSGPSSQRSHQIYPPHNSNTNSSQIPHTSINEVNPPTCPSSKGVASASPSLVPHPYPANPNPSSTETDYNVALYMTELQYSSSPKNTENTEASLVSSTSSTSTSSVASMVSSVTTQEFNESGLQNSKKPIPTSLSTSEEQSKLTPVKTLDNSRSSKYDDSFLENLTSIKSIQFPCNGPGMLNYSNLANNLPINDYIPQISIHESVVYNQLMWLNINISSFLPFTSSSKISLLSSKSSSSIMPSQTRINRSLVIYFKLFHSNYPFLHPQSLDLNNSPILLLSIFLLGEKIYQKEIIKSAMINSKNQTNLSEIHQNSIFCKSLHNSLKMSLFRIINLFEGPRRKQNEIPIWVLQSLILSIFFESDLGHQDIESNYVIEDEFSNSMSHYLTEVIISKLEQKQKGVNCQVGSDGSNNQWESWIESELIRRLFFTLFVVFTKNDTSANSSCLSSTSSLLLSQLFDRSDITIRFPYSSLNWNKFFFNKAQFELAILDQEYVERRDSYSKISESDLISFIFEDDKAENNPERSAQYLAFLRHIIQTDERFNLAILNKIILSKISRLRIRDQYMKKFLQKGGHSKDDEPENTTDENLYGAYFIPIMKIYSIIRNQTNFGGQEKESNHIYERIGNGNGGQFDVVMNHNRLAFDNLLSSELKDIIGSSNLSFPRTLLFQQYLKIVAFKINVNQEFSSYFKVLKESFKLIQIQEMGKFLNVNKVPIVSGFKSKIKDMIVTHNNNSAVGHNGTLLIDIVKNCFDLFWLEFHVGKYFDNDANKTFVSTADILVSDNLSQYDNNGDDEIISHIIGRNDILLKLQRILILSIWMNLIESSIHGVSPSSVASANKMRFSTNHSVSILNDDSDSTVHSPFFVDSESRMVFEKIKQRLISISYPNTGVNEQEPHALGNFVLLNNSGNFTNFSASILYYYSNFLTQDQVDRKNEGALAYYNDINDNMEKKRLCAVLADLLGTLSKEMIY